MPAPAAVSFLGLVIGCISLNLKLQEIWTNGADAVILESKHRDYLRLFFQELKQTLLDLDAVNTSMFQHLPVPLSPEAKAKLVLSVESLKSLRLEDGTQEEFTALRDYWQEYYDMYISATTEISKLILLLVQHKSFNIAENNTVSLF
jgi:hypothetical protein